MSGDISPYLALVTSEHADKPNFIAWLSAQLQGLADGLAVVDQFTPSYDVDSAIGTQLDVVGQWVGQSRFIALPLSVYFTLDADGLGFDQGIWYESFNPITGLVALPDDEYRLLLKAVIVANQWDGTIPGAYAAWANLFTASNYGLVMGNGPYLGVDPESTLDINNSNFIVYIQDYDDMTMIIGIYGNQPSAITLALLTGGYIKLKPAGVRIRGYAVPTVPNAPIFMLDAPTTASGVGAGFDVGNWAAITPA